jgi:hypothetical protein
MYTCRKRLVSVTGRTRFSKAHFYYLRENMMKTLKPLLVLLTAVVVLEGCINPDQGGQRGKNEGRDTNTATDKITLLKLST